VARLVVTSIAWSAGPIAAIVVACSTKPVPVVDALAPPVVDAAAPPPPHDAEAPLVIVDAAAAPEAADPFGVAKTAARAGCAVLDGHVAKKDIETSFVDGDDLLALVNRSPTGSLSPDYAPTDMVDVRNGKAQTAADCEKTQCLRKDTATALNELLDEMKKAGWAGHVESAFRSYGMQCGTFGNWARKGSFCDATEQSALPGHSQHQLGTTVDLFTEEWAKDERGVFREGFGCTDAGRWIREHATDFGFVMPYPIHPDDRNKKQKCTTRWDIPVNINPKTGYRFEHWHIRYLGKEAAKRFKVAFDARGINGPDELTVEQWIRTEKGIGGADTELSVCDTCNCGACATLAAPGESTCDKKGGALHLDEHGKPRASEAAPTISEVTRGKGKKWSGKVVEVKLDIPVGLPTQPPITGAGAASYNTGETFTKLAPYPETDPRAFIPLAGAWVVAVEPIPNDTGIAWPYRAALSASTNGAIYNHANLLLPTHTGPTTIRIPIPGTSTKAKVVLLKGGVPQGQERAAPLD
jgi:D-alanyl-D-alanine carboxypeptidase